MKKILSIITLLLICSLPASAQKRISIMGDSYSTFRGHIPAHYAPWYPMPPSANDVAEVEQTWWKLLIASGDYVLEKNDSWSGSTICNTGYQRAGEGDYSDRSFVSRVNFLGDPNIILIFGGTNDAWAGSPIGEYQYSDWTRRDLYSYRPALAYLLSQLKMLYPQAEIYFILNSELKESINESSAVICKKYDVPLIALHDIDKQMSHPSKAGMKAISEQVGEFIKK